jgi:hypothetical protein
VHLIQQERIQRFKRFRFLLDGAVEARHMGLSMMNALTS